MSSVDVLLIGGGVASAAAAAELRARGFDGSVLLVTRELEPPYHRPPVTKDLLVGRIERDAVAVREPGWWAEHDVELRTRAGVMKLDLDARVATLADKSEIAFGSALLATGAMVRRLRLDGSQLQGIHYLRAPGNAVALRAELDATERVVVVGGSFLGAEVAASLATLGKSCTLVMQEALPLERAFGPTVGRFAAGVLARRGVEILPSEDVTGFEGEGRVQAVLTASGKRLPADVVVIGAGAVPDVMLATKSGLEIGETGGIRCDAALQTSAPGVYAAGDVCEYESVLHGARVRIEHEDHAMEQGRTAARNIVAGAAAEPHAAVPYFWCELSDWLRLDYVGLGGAWDGERVTGDYVEERFTVWYLTGGVVTGALCVRRPEDLDVARTLIAERAPEQRIPELIGDATT